MGIRWKIYPCRYNVCSLWRAHLAPPVLRWQRCSPCCESSLEKDNLVVVAGESFCGSWQEARGTVVMTPSLRAVAPRADVATFTPRILSFTFEREEASVVSLVDERTRSLPGVLSTSFSNSNSNGSKRPESLFQKRRSRSSWSLFENSSKKNLRRNFCGGSWWRGHLASPVLPR